MRTLTIDIPMLKQDVFLAVGSRKDTMRALLKVCLAGARPAIRELLSDIRDDEDWESTQATTMTQKGVGICAVAFTVPPSRRGDGMKVLVHEMVHVAQFIMEVKGMEDDEFEAYLVEYLVGEALSSEWKEVEINATPKCKTPSSRGK